MKKLIIIVIFGLINLPIYTQAPDWNTVGNFVNSTDFLGTTNNQNLTLTRNNLPRATFGNLNPWVGLNGDTDLNASRITLGLNGEINPAWSMLHLWEGNLTAAMYRNWFNVGTSYTGNGDFMYTGLMHRPVAEPSGYATDAVIAWGCQDSAMTNDNFRFIYIENMEITRTNHS